MKISFYSALVALLLSVLPKVEAATLTLSDAFMIAADGTTVPIGGDDATAFNSGGPTSGAAWEYAARERETRHRPTAGFRLSFNLIPLLSPPLM